MDSRVENMRGAGLTAWPRHASCAAALRLPQAFPQRKTAPLRLKCIMPSFVHKAFVHVRFAPALYSMRMRRPLPHRSNPAPTAAANTTVTTPRQLASSTASTARLDEQVAARERPPLPAGAARHTATGHMTGQRV
jgi:hypothetical protein